MKVVALFFLLSFTSAFAQSLEDFVKEEEIICSVKAVLSDDTVHSDFSVRTLNYGGFFGIEGSLVASSMNWGVDVDSKKSKDGKGYIKVEVEDYNKSTAGMRVKIFSATILHRGFGTYSVLTRNGVRLELELKKVEPAK